MKPTSASDTPAGTVTPFGTPIVRQTPLGRTRARAGEGGSLWGRAKRVIAASCKCIFFHPFFHSYVRLFNKPTACMLSFTWLLCVTDFRTRLCGHSFVSCLGAAELVRLALEYSGERTVSFWQANSTSRFKYRASLHILPLVLSGCYSSYLYAQDSAH